MKKLMGYFWKPGSGRGIGENLEWEEINMRILGNTLQRMKIGFLRDH
jgi:hypothetical protein